MALLSTSNEAATAEESEQSIFLPRGPIGRVTSTFMDGHAQ